VIVVVPGAGSADTASTSPDPIPMVAMAGLLLLHVPPATGCVSVVVRPSHNEAGPTIAAGAAVTVTTSNDVQLGLNAYVSVVVPVLRPVRMPEVEPMVPTAVLLLDQVPPGVPLV